MNDTPKEKLDKLSESISQALIPPSLTMPKPTQVSNESEVKNVEQSNNRP